LTVGISLLLDWEMVPARTSTAGRERGSLPSKD
jgi:hypothetical protein